MKTAAEIWEELEGFEELEEESAEGLEEELEAAVEKSLEELEWLTKRRGKITGSNFHMLMGSVSKEKLEEAKVGLDTAVIPPVEVLNEQGHRKGKSYTDWAKEQIGTICKQSDVDGWRKRVESANEISNMGVHYLRRVVAEAMGSEYSFSSASVEWGREHEATAIQVYEQMTGSRVDSSPFQFYEATKQHGGTILRGLAGSTPDGVIWRAERVAGGTIEVKCPKDPAFHLATVASGKIPTSSGHNYVPQCDAHMLFTGADWCDFVSFDPRMPENEPSRIVIVRRERCEQAMENLVRRLEIAANWITQTVTQIRSRQAREHFERFSAKQLGNLTREDREAVMSMMGGENTEE